MILWKATKEIDLLPRKAGGFYFILFSGNYIIGLFWATSQSPISSRSVLSFIIFSRKSIKSSTLLPDFAISLFMSCRSSKAWWWVRRVSPYSSMKMPVFFSSISNGIVSALYNSSVMVNNSWFPVCFYKYEYSLFWIYCIFSQPNLWRIQVQRKI